MKCLNEYDDTRFNSENNLEDEWMDIKEIESKKKVRKLIEERLEEKRLKEELGDEFDDDFDWNDFN